MSNRELVVLGTASQAPTRSRSHNGYFLRWDDEGFLFDPGEETQRQMLFAGVTASRITRICITHFHRDHCLGPPGVLQRKRGSRRMPHRDPGDTDLVKPILASEDDTADAFGNWESGSTAPPRGAGRSTLPIPSVTPDHHSRSYNASQ